MFSFFIQGLIIGFAIAAPVGPIGVLGINRTLSYGLFVGLITGLGAAVADAVYGCVAGFGLVSVTDFLINQKTLIKILGGIFLIYLGIKTFFQAVPKNNQLDKAHSRWEDFTSTLVLTLTNPATILSFIGIYASLGIVELKTSYFEALVIVLGVFLGSLLWWCILSASVNAVRHKLSDGNLKWINRLSGVVLSVFGLFALFY